MADISEAGKQKPTLSSRLPKLSKVSRLILLIGIFLIILIPLILIQNQQRAEQTDYEQEILLLQRILAKPTTQVSSIEDEISQIEASLNVIKNKFPAENRTAEVLDQLINLADSNEIYITSAATSIGEQTVVIGGEEITYPSMNCFISIEGDSAKFQNFLTDIDELETCEISTINISVSSTESGSDTADLDMNILLKE
jgi:acetolactate synthase small subunit